MNSQQRDELGKRVFDNAVFGGRSVKLTNWCDAAAVIETLESLGYMVAPLSKAPGDWPKLTVGRLKDGDRTPEIHHGAVEHGPAWEHETYVPLSEVKEELLGEEAARIVAEAMVKHSSNGSTPRDFSEWEPESQRLWLADVQAGLDALADARFSSTDSEGRS